MEKRELIEEVVQHNSETKNIICCIEEMSELIKVLTKYLRESPKYNHLKLKEELGHVLLMCNVIAYKFDISEDDILKEWKYAIERMNEDIN